MKGARGANDPINTVVRTTVAAVSPIAVATPRPMDSDAVSRMACCFEICPRLYRLRLTRPFIVPHNAPMAAPPATGLTLAAEASTAETPTAGRNRPTPRPSVYATDARTELDCGTLSIPIDPLSQDQDERCQFKPRKNLCLDIIRAGRVS